MKNSAWYHKLWLKKLSELPLKEDSDSAWAGMKDMLDKQLPVSSSGGHGGSAGTSAAKPFIAKLIALVGYSLPVAAAIGVTTYFVAPLVIKPKQAELKKKQESHLRIDKSPAVLADSLKDTTIVKEDTSIDTISPITSSKAETAVKDLITAEKAIHGNQHTDDRLTGKSGKQNSSKPDLSIASQSSAIAKASKANLTAGAIKTNSAARINSIARADQTAGKDFNSGSSISIPASESRKNEKQASAVSGTQEKQKNAFTEKTAELLTANKPDKAVLNDKAPATKSTKKNKANKTQKAKDKKTTDITTPPYDLGLETGLNTGKSSSLYLGVFGSYRVTTRLLLNAGIRLNTSTVLAGSYTSKPYSVPRDSTSHQYKISDSRKVMMLNVPLTLEYRISGRISVNAGPVISFPLSQTSVKSQSELLKGQGTVNLRLDTLRKRSVDSTLTHTTLNKINLGITGGVSVRIKQFYIEAKYLQNLSPYKVNSSLGGYQQSYKSVQLGIRYKFKK